MSAGIVMMMMRREEEVGVGGEEEEEEVGDEARSTFRRRRQETNDDDDEECTGCKRACFRRRSGCKLSRRSSALRAKRSVQKRKRKRTCASENLLGRRRELENVREVEKRQLDDEASSFFFFLSSPSSLTLSLFLRRSLVLPLLLRSLSLAPFFSISQRDQEEKQVALSFDPQTQPCLLPFPRRSSKGKKSR